MPILQIILLASIQGAAELLPVSSSAHVIVAERLLGLNPSDPALTFLLVMLHTGTMFAVLLYFWQRWVKLIREGSAAKFIRAIVIATAVTGVIGLILKAFIEKIILIKILGHQKGEIEELFASLPVVATSLFVVGCYILYASKARAQKSFQENLSDQDSFWIGLTQAICLPFRGLSRSGATISTALIRNLSRPIAEDFSFALAVVLTPPVIALELHRLLKSNGDQPSLHFADLVPMLEPGLIGMVFSFIAGLLALKWLSRWLEQGKWAWFGVYCIVASMAVIFVNFNYGVGASLF